MGIKGENPNHNSDFSTEYTCVSSGLNTHRLSMSNFSLGILKRSGL